MVQSIWWYLSMKYHRDATPGHTFTNTSKECYECKEIKALFDKMNDAKAFVEPSYLQGREDASNDVYNVINNKWNDGGWGTRPLDRFWNATSLLTIGTKAGKPVYVSLYEITQAALGKFTPNQLTIPFGEGEAPAGEHKKGRKNGNT